MVLRFVGLRHFIVALHDEGDSNPFLHDNEIFHVNPKEQPRDGDVPMIGYRMVRLGPCFLLLFITCVSILTKLLIGSI